MAANGVSERRAFVLRMAPSGRDCVHEALADGQLRIGWSKADGLLNTALGWEAFRARLRDVYHAQDTNQRRAGAAAGNMWRFVREMAEGDFIVVPHGKHFYVGSVRGPATYDAMHVVSDTAYRRAVLWTNATTPFARRTARAALQSRMKTQGTCVEATDLLDEIEEFAQNQGAAIPRFETDVRRKLASQLLSEIRSGRIENFGFEKLLRSILRGLGASAVKIIPRQNDKGADLIASFRVAGAFDVRVAIQAKHFQAKPPAGADVIEQLARGMLAEEADLGIAITSGTFSAAATTRASAMKSEQGLRIELLDGEQLAALVIEYGLVGDLSIE